MIVSPRKPVTQVELKQLEDAQRAVWDAGIYAADLAREIEQRIKAGAEIEQGKLFFDPKTKLARGTRRKEA